MKIPIFQKQNIIPICQSKSHRALLYTKNRTRRDIDGRKMYFHSRSTSDEHSRNRRK